MKRIFTWTLAVLCFLAYTGTAAAVDIKVRGQYEIAIGWSDSLGFSDHPSADPFSNSDNSTARQRFRTQIDFIASEYVSGVVLFEIGNIDWGRNPGGNTGGRGSGGALDADGVNIETKRAYLDWVFPGANLTVRMGIQGVSLPMGTKFKNPVIFSDVAGVVGNYTFNETYGLTAFWLRPFDAYGSDPDGSDLRDEVDLFGISAPVTGNGWKLTPWAMYGSLGASSGLFTYLTNYTMAYHNTIFTENSSASAWWLGLAAEFSLFDPLSFGLDAMYGDMHKANVGGWSGYDAIGTRGWFIDAILQYKMDWGSPGIFGWWTSGDSANTGNTGQFGRIPVFGGDAGYDVSSFGAKRTTITDNGILSATMVGTWGIAVQLADMSFADKLSHTLRVLYYKGTNDSEIVRQGRQLHLSTEIVFLTDKDAAFEINFDHKYQMYDNFVINLELGYIRLALDDSVWNHSNRGPGGIHGGDTNAAWKAQFLFQYLF